MKSSKRIMWAVIFGVICVAAIIYAVVRSAGNSGAPPASPTPSPAAQGQTATSTPAPTPTSATSTSSVGVSASGTSGLTVTITTSTPGQSTTWVSSSNLHYGLSFGHPANDAFSASGGSYIDSGLPFGPLAYTATSTNFPPTTDAGAEAGSPIVLGTTIIPATDYPGTTLRGALFGVSVDPAITSSTVCGTFGNYGIPRAKFPIAVDGVSYDHVYVTIALASGYTGIYDTAHVFRNGLCYEFSLGSETGNGTGLAAWDETSTLKAFISHATFSAPQ